MKTKAKVNSVTIPRWVDRHVHWRDGDMSRIIVPCTLNQRPAGVVIMGNLKYPDETSTIKKAMAYRERLRSIVPPNDDYKLRRCKICMTCYLTDDITPEEVVRGFKIGVWGAVKLYMADQKGQGGTTGSHSGVRDLVGRYPVFEAMEKHGIPLLIHLEAVEKKFDEFDREVISLERDLMPLLEAYPGLCVVVEHITDSRVADFVAQAPYIIQATVTAHHLMINRNAMFWGGMNPGHYCRPVPKREEHRQRIREYVTSGNRRFGAGTDSAPHDEMAKSRCYGCAAGIFTAPVAVELYTTVFDEDDALKYLGNFLSRNFVELYGLRVSEEKMTIKRTSLIVPQKVGSVQVFRGGSTLPWRLVD